MFYPVKVSEFEVQARLYSELLSRGYDVRGEVCYPLVRHKCRFDLVIFNDRLPVCIIEVKDGLFVSVEREEYHYHKWKNTRQGRLYRSLGIKVFYCRGMERIEFILKEISSFIEGLK